MSNIYIVAEIGCNHNGSVDIAREMILKAKEAGVNAVKFQTFKADKLISAIAPKAEYQIKNTGELESQLEMTKKGNDSNLLIVFYVQIMPDDFVMQLHRF